MLPLNHSSDSQQGQELLCPRPNCQPRQGVYCQDGLRAETLCNNLRKCEQAHEGHAAPCPKISGTCALTIEAENLNLRMWSKINRPSPSGTWSKSLQEAIDTSVPE